MFGLFRRTVAAALLALAAIATVTAQVRTTVVSLKVSKETAPPGGLAQMKVFITEPQPISTGGGKLSFDAYDSIQGIALASPSNDTYGVAVVQGTAVDLSIVSPSATFGTATDYPVLTIAGFVGPAAPIGTKFPLTFDSLSLSDPSGAPYLTDVKPGRLMVQPGLSVHDVKPGSADLPAGAVVSIFGSSFEPGTTVKFKEAKLAEVRYVSPGRIDVVLGQPVQMHGTKIMLSNPDGSRVDYFSYERTHGADPSERAVFVDVVPVFPHREALATGVSVAGARSGLAVQNIDGTAASVTAELFGADGLLLGTRTFPLAADRYIVRELDELFGPYTNGATLCVKADRPIQVMGVAVDGAVARPVIPTAALPAICQ
jgi:hypothetical protein